MADEPLTLVLLPTGAGAGRFGVDAPRPDEPPSLVAAAVAKRLRRAFEPRPEDRDDVERAGARGLVHLAAAELRTTLPPTLAFGREVGKAFLTAACALPDPDVLRQGDDAGVLPPPTAELASLALRAPPLRGGETLTVVVLAGIWDALRRHVQAELAAFDGPAAAWVKTLGPDWHVLGRVCFHLAENKASTAAPFAFLATYAKGIGAGGKVVHAPLAKALQEHAGDRQKLLALLYPVHEATKHSEFLRALVDGEALYAPTAWSPDEAWGFLQDVAVYERAGIAVRVPDWWRARPRPVVHATIGKTAAAGMGADALLDFDWRVTVGDEQLVQGEIDALIEGGTGLRFVKGRWVEVDATKLREVLDQWTKVAGDAEKGVSILDGLRMLARAPLGADDRLAAAAVDSAHVVVEAGPWLDEVLASLRVPDGGARFDPIGVLRPYQKDGVAWMHVVTRLQLGACLADDMGLGKTVQVLALLLTRKESATSPTLVVAPASLIPNWRAEIAKFAPSLRVVVAHPSEMDVKTAPALKDVDVVLTTYGTVGRAAWLKATRFSLVVLDEAQNIKNPAAQQTRAVKALQSDARVALSGTPVENRLGDLWSLFDFLNPGLLGNAKAFSTAVKKMEADQSQGFAPLKSVIKPFLLRRLKTDKSVVDDLPEKTEVRAYCGLTKAQAALYQAQVSELQRALKSAEGMRRRGIVLSSLMRLKQICNHPSQATGDGSWRWEDSAKLTRLGELAEPIIARQEKLLCFTQFKEMTGPLHDFLAARFGRAGIVLHGEVAVKKRGALVEQFQRDDGPPFFVLSLKAGGTGLNLTAANHVVHFDRWWNPAVEDQATDRAFRIGQKKNVMVHKLVCKGTIEDRVDALIDAKRALAEGVLGGGGEEWLTELSTDELLRFVKLDLSAAMAEAA